MILTIVSRLQEASRIETAPIAAALIVDQNTINAGPDQLKSPVSFNSN